MSSKQGIYDKLWKENKWDELRAHLFHWLADEPDDHWILAQIAECYYLTKQFEKALECAEKAWKSDSRCPMAIWLYAECLLRLKQFDAAEQLYRSLIRRGVNRIAYGQCGEGIRDARTVVNDSRYTLGIIQAYKDEFDLAERNIQKHIASRNPNCTSRFNLREVKKDLNQVRQGKKPKIGSE
jgi:tetratricopeptide (TPR) repeat protein